MIYQPVPGQTYQVWYAKRAAALMPLHGRTATVIAKSNGPGPRNVKVDVDGCWFIVPRGNLRRLC